MENNNYDVNANNDEISTISLSRNDDNHKHQGQSDIVDTHDIVDTYVQAPDSPFDGWDKINKNNIINTNNADINDMGYDYQIIIELSGESNIVRGDERLASKHPDKTVIMQYDVNSGELKTVYGDLDKMQGDNVRWILSSHGGNKINGNNTLFSKYTSEQLVVGLIKLKSKNKKLVNPNKIVLAGCNLGSEGNIDHYGLNAARMLWINDFTASVQAYTEIIEIDETGERYTDENGNTHRRKYKSHRIDYKKEPNKPIMVNGVTVVKLIIDDIKNGRISIENAVYKYEDILNDFLPYNDGINTWSLLKEIGSRDDRYVEFCDYINKILDGEISSTVNFIDYVLNRRTFGKNKTVNIWKMPNPEAIYANPLAKPTSMDYDYQVIIQLADDDILIESNERLASKHPDKTLIIQYDIKSRESRIVFGDPNKLQGRRVRWILSGHGNGGQHLLESYSAEEIYAGVDYLKNSRNMIGPGKVILLSCGLGMQPSDGIKKHFALEYAELMQKNKDKALLVAYTKNVGVHANGQRLTREKDSNKYHSKNMAHRVNYFTTSPGQLMINGTSIVTYILMDIAAEKVNVVKAAERYKEHLRYYFADSDGEIDIKVLSQTANDPLKWKKYLKYINSKKHHHKSHKGKLWFYDGDDVSLSLKEKVNNAVTLYDYISEYPDKYNKLSETSQHELSSLKDTMENSGLSLRSNNRLSKIANNLGRGNQTIAFTRLIISTSMMLKRYNSSKTTEQEKKEINEELTLNWSEFSVDFGIDVMQPYFEKGAMFFDKKIPFTKGVGQVGSRVGRLVAKSAGSILNIASAGFDIYNVVKIYGQLEKETDPDNARDLIVNGTFSALGAGVGILTAAALAVGFAIAGPIGILAGIGISLATMIYNAASTIAKIKEQIDLTPWEEINNGTRLAFGADLEKSVAARLDEKQKRLMRESIDQYSQEIANKRLIPSGVTEYYYAYDKYGEVKKIQYYYINKEKNDYLLDILNFKVDGFFMHEGELINKDTGQIVSESDYKNNWIKCSYKEYEEYGKNKEYVVETRLEDVFDVSENTDVAIILDKELFESKYSDDYVEYNNILALDKARSERMGHLLLSSSANKKEHFNTGVGDAYIFADRHTQNSFDITQGRKVFYGGDLDDVFYLHGNELIETSQPSQLDGRKGEDTISVLGVNHHNVIGYKIDLMSGTVHYNFKHPSISKTNATRLLANISNIEHIHSSEDTDDILIGNDQVNVINGMGGWNILKGYGGNDLLSLQSGEAYGGVGFDNYKILQNKQVKSVSVTLFEQPGNETSNVILDYSLQNIDDIYLSGNDVYISLSNENNTVTTLILKDVYSDIESGDKIRNNDFIFYTKDGFILQPQWQTTLVNKSSYSDGDFNSTLTTYQFSNKSSTLSDANNHVQNTFISKKGGVNTVKIDNVDVVLKKFIDPMLIGHKFSSDTLEGNVQDNIFHQLGAGDNIYVSSGDDEYIIDTMVLPDNAKHDTLTLSNNGRHDWTIGNEQTFYLNDISGDDLQITLNISYGEQEAIISHKYLPDDYLKIKLPMPEEGNLVYNQFFVVDKDKKCFIVKYNFLEAIISHQPPFEIPGHRNLTENNDYFTISKGDHLIEPFDASADDDIDRLINDMANMQNQKKQYSVVSNDYSYISPSGMPMIAAAQ